MPVTFSYDICFQQKQYYVKENLMQYAFFESFCDKCDFRKGYEGFEACTLEVRIIVAILACILNQAYLV